MRNNLAARILIFFSRRRLPIASQVVMFFLGCRIGARLPATSILPHPLGIVIGPGVRIGNNVLIWHQVTIIAHGASSAAPQIGDGASIGPGAKILGGILIGRNARIGANAVVTKDVPAGRSLLGTGRLVDGDEFFLG
jgi:serine O-acetyltransferase